MVDGLKGIKDIVKDASVIARDAGKMIKLPDLGGTESSRQEKINTGNQASTAGNITRKTKEEFKTEALRNGGYSESSSSSTTNIERDGDGRIIGVERENTGSNRGNSRPRTGNNNGVEYDDDIDVGELKAGLAALGTKTKGREFIKSLDQMYGGIIGENGKINGARLGDAIEDAAGRSGISVNDLESGRNGKGINRNAWKDLAKAVSDGNLRPLNQSQPNQSQPNQPQRQSTAGNVVVPTTGGGNVPTQNAPTQQAPAPLETLPPVDAALQAKFDALIATRKMTPEQTQLFSNNVAKALTTVGVNVKDSPSDELLAWINKTYPDKANMIRTGKDAQGNAVDGLKVIDASLVELKDKADKILAAQKDVPQQQAAPAKPKDEGITKEQLERTLQNTSDKKYIDNIKERMLGTRGENDDITNKGDWLGKYAKFMNENADKATIASIKATVANIQAGDGFDIKGTFEKADANRKNRENVTQNSDKYKETLGEKSNIVALEQALLPGASHGKMLRNLRDLGYDSPDGLQGGLKNYLSDQVSGKKDMPTLPKEVVEFLDAAKDKGNGRNDQLKMNDLAEKAANAISAQVSESAAAVGKSKETPAAPQKASTGPSQVYVGGKYVPMDQARAAFESNQAQTHQNSLDQARKAEEQYAKHNASVAANAAAAAAKPAVATSTADGQAPAAPVQAVSANPPSVIAPTATAPIAPLTQAAPVAKPAVPSLSPEAQQLSQGVQKTLQGIAENPLLKGEKDKLMGQAAEQLTKAGIPTTPETAAQNFSNWITAKKPDLAKQIAETAPTDVVALKKLNALLSQAAEALQKEAALKAAAKGVAPLAGVSGGQSATTPSPAVGGSKPTPVGVGRQQ